MSAREEIRLDEAGLSEVLAIARGEALLVGGDAWTLREIHGHHEGGALLSFGREGTRQTLGLQLRPRDDAQPAWRRTRHLDAITHLPADADKALRARSLDAFGALIERLEGSEGPETRVVDPETAQGPPPEARTLALPARWRPETATPFEFGRVFVLDLPSDCGFSCNFCSTRSKLSPVTRFDEASTRRLEARMQRAFVEEGFRVLRLSGLDPLRHPEILRLVAHATRLGFEHVHLYSPSTRLAEAAFLDALLGALPASYTLHLPLYGADAATHEAVTGVPGSFDAIERVFENLRARGRLGQVVVVTVVNRANLAGVASLRRLTEGYGVPVQVFLPFPATRSSRDAFYAVALSQTELVGPLAACDPPLGLSELLPCVRFRHERDTGRPALSVGGFAPVTAPLGTLFQHGAYRRATDTAVGNTFTIPVVPCPHASACALSTVCPRSVYRAYAERFGVDELQPVAVWELLELGLGHGLTQAAVEDPEDGLGE